MQRLIDAVKLVKQLESYGATRRDVYIPTVAHCVSIVKDAPTVDAAVDAVPVVRCKDCKLYVEEDGKMVCEVWEAFGKKASPPPFGYCHAGIRKDGEKDAAD